MKSYIWQVCTRHEHVMSSQYVPGMNMLCLLHEYEPRALSAQRRRNQPAFIMIMIMKLVSVSSQLHERHPELNLDSGRYTEKIIQSWVKKRTWTGVGGQVWYAIPVSYILGWLPVVPVGDTGTTPFKMREESAEFLGAACHKTKKDGNDRPLTDVSGETWTAGPCHGESSNNHEGTTEWNSKSRDFFVLNMRNMQNMWSYGWIICRIC